MSRAVNSIEIKIAKMINAISKESIVDFCREKSGDFIPSSHAKITDAALFPKEFAPWFDCVEIVGYFSNFRMLVFHVPVNNKKILGERSCRARQFAFARNLLKQANNTLFGIFTAWIKTKPPSDIGQALFVFSDKHHNFRFSYIENINAVADKMPQRFRRFTFYVSSNNGQSNRTFVDRMKMPWSSRDELEMSFSVQALSDEFFGKYKEHYENFVCYVTGKRFVKKGDKWVEKIVHPPHPTIYASFGNDDKRVRDYVKKLMGRLVFLKFLEKKLWLGVREGGKWGEGDPSYLRRLFDEKKVQKAFKDNFLDKVLEPLFFDSLNAKRTDDVADAILSPYRTEKVRIPYLNGGLFEKEDIDSTNIPFPDDYFEDLFDTFDSFNFTIDENGPEDAEIGVDPEMLSRIFENLLEDNKDKGAFYTPKEIVDYMCKKSLIAHLGETPAVRELVENYASNEDLADKFTDGEKAALIEKLAKVKICDPAIGSGAFPMGMLAILCRLRLRLEGKEENSANIVALKKEIIQNNIYGVDIEAGAVDIARLRFWLSIVVDENEPIPLPNLDYKIMQGNSLLESYGGVDLSHVLDGGGTTVKISGKNKGKKKAEFWQTEFAFDAKAAVDEIVRDKAQLFDTTDHAVKAKLVERINKNVKAYISHKLPSDSPYATTIPDGPNPNFMLWHLYFSEVFKDGGFDIVIGNPPYFNIQSLGAKSPYAEAVKNDYPEIWQDKSDILFYFFALALRISKNVIVYITSNAYPYSNKAKKLRNVLLEDGRLKKIINFERYNIFNSADITTCITFLGNGCSGFSAVNHKGVDGDLRDVIEYIRDGANSYEVTLKKDDVFALVNTDVSNINKHIDGEHPILRSIVKIGKGMETAANDVFCFSERPAGFPNQFIKKRMCGESVKKYAIAQRDEYILYFEDVETFTELPVEIQAYLERNKEVLLNRATVRNEGRPWWRYSRPMHKEFYHLNKIWCSYRAKENIFALDESTDYIGLTNTTVIFDTNPDYPLKYLLALLNSKVLNFRYRSIGKQTGNGLFEYFENGVGKLPIPRTSKEQRQTIISLVDQILDAKKSDSNADTSALESKIDDLVYDLYGLTDEERAIVDPERFGKKEGEKIGAAVVQAQVAGSAPQDDSDSDDDARD